MHILNAVLATLVAIPVSIEAPPTEAQCTAFIKHYHQDVQAGREIANSMHRMWDVCTDKFDSALELNGKLLVESFVRKGYCTARQSMDECFDSYIKRAAPLNGEAR